MDANDIYAPFERMQQLVPVANALDQFNHKLRIEIDPSIADPDAWMFDQSGRKFAAVSSDAAGRLAAICREFLELCSADFLDYIGDLDPIRHEEDDWYNAEGWELTYWHLLQIHNAAKKLCAAVFLDRQEWSFERTWKAGEFRFGLKLKEALTAIESYEPFCDVVVLMSVQREVPTYCTPQSETLVSKGPAGDGDTIDFDYVPEATARWIEERQIATSGKAAETEIKVTPIEPPTSKPTVGVRKMTVEDHMRRLIETKPESAHWSASQFAESIQCSPGSVKGTEFWRSLMVAREASKNDRMVRDFERRA